MAADQHGRAATYSFRSGWVLPAPRASVHAVLADLAGYPDWWPEVRAVAAVGEEDAWVRVRSRLPYTLDLVLQAEVRDPGRLETSVRGDLRGTVRWLLDDEGVGTRLRFEQDVTVTGWIRWLSPLLRPLLVWNHDQMMRSCRAHLPGAAGALRSGAPPG